MVVIDYNNAIGIVLHEHCIQSYIYISMKSYCNNYVITPVKLASIHVYICKLHYSTHSLMIDRLIDSE